MGDLSIIIFFPPGMKRGKKVRKINKKKKKNE